MSMLRWPRVERELTCSRNESTPFEAPLESKKEKLRRKTPKRKTPNAVKARGAHGALPLSIQRREGTPSPTSIRGD